MKRLLSLFLLVGLNCWAGVPPAKLIPFFTTPVNSGSSLADVAASFPMDEATGNTTGATRVDKVGGLQWLDKNNNLYGIRGVAGGAVCDGANSAANYLGLTNSLFDQGSGKSFTITFWACCGNGGVLGEWTSTAANDYDYYCQVGGNNNFNAFCIDLGGTSRQCTSTNANAAPGSSSRTFTFCAFGYDAAQQWWWASANAYPKNPLTGVSGVRATGGRGFVCVPHLAIVDDVNYWRRALTQQELTNIYAGGFADTYPFGTTPGTSVANQYGWAVTNSGGVISTTTYNATKALANSFYNSNILAKFSVLMGMPNETLEGALETIVCPVYFQGDGRGIEPAVRPFKNFHSFVNGDVSVNGVTGNGSSKWAQINYLSAATSDLLFQAAACNSGAVIYCYTASSTGCEFGAEDGFASPQFDYAFKVNSTTFNGSAHTTQAWWGYDNGTCYASSAIAGYYGIQRDAINSMNLYFANSTHTHSSIMSTNAVMTSCAQSRSQTFPLWCYFDGNLCGGCTFSGNTISFFGINYVVLSSADSLAAYTGIQTYRTSIGGGFQ